MEQWDPAFFQDILDNLYDGVYYVDRHRRIIYWNQAAERLSGFAAAEVVGRTCQDNLLRHINAAGVNLCENGCPLAATLVDGQPRRAEVYLHHKDGHRLPVMVRVSPIRSRAKEIVGAVEIFSDNKEMSDTLERLRHLENLAYLDPLTGLANRRYLEQFLEARFNELSRFGWRFGLIFADLDHFKNINDTYGHEAGDQVLKMVATTLSRNLRSFDLVGRWGGEEFLVVTTHIHTEDHLLQVAERLRRLVEHSWVEAAGQPLRVTISLGATMAESSDTLHSLIHRADALMQRCKNTGRNCVLFG